MTITQKIDDLAAELKQVNFADSKDAVGFLKILFPVAAEAGLDKFRPDWQSPEIQQVVKIARSWVNAAKAHIPQMTAGDALEVLSAYDFLCCITGLLPGERTFLDEQLLKVFEARIHGDKTVNEYRLYDAIELQLRRKNKLFSDRPLRWNAISISRWYDDFEYGCSLSKLSDYDTIEIVNILLNTDLFMFVGNDNGKFKQQLFDNHKHLLDKIPTMTPDELAATSLLLANARPYLPEPQRTAYDQALTAALLAHASTNPTTATPSTAPLASSKHKTNFENFFVHL